MINLDNLTYPIVQLSLDLTSLDEAIETAEIGVAAGVDWLEAGTPLRDIAVLNAAAALIVAGQAVNLADGAALAAHAIESGAARKALERLVAITNGRG